MYLQNLKENYLEIDQTNNIIIQYNIDLLSNSYVSVIVRGFGLITTTVTMG